MANSDSFINTHQKVKQEVMEIIEKLNLNCSVWRFKFIVNWIDISTTQRLSEGFIRKYKNRVHWPSISFHQELSEDFIAEFEANVDWMLISENQVLTEDFIRDFQNRVDWSNISRCQKLSESFIREFQAKVDWDMISYHRILSDDFIREIQDKLNWENISSCQKLSENFIRDYQHKVNWKMISSHQKLSENFIREFQDKVVSKEIFSSIELSDDFVKEFKNKIIIKKATSYKSKKHNKKSLKKHYEPNACPNCGFSYAYDGLYCKHCKSKFNKEGAEYYPSSSLWDALKNHDHSGLEKLLKTGSNPNIYDEHGITPLYWTAKENQEVLAKCLLYYNADVNLCLSRNAKHSEGLSPLHIASLCCDDVSLILLLIAHGAELNNSSNKAGQTPLSMAAGNGCLEAVKALLEAGADATIRCSGGLTPSELAAEEGHKSIVSLLQKRIQEDSKREQDENEYLELIKQNKNDDMKLIEQARKQLRQRNYLKCKDLLSRLNDRSNLSSAIIKMEKICHKKLQEVQEESNT